MFWKIFSISSSEFGVTECSSLRLPVLELKFIETLTPNLRTTNNYLHLSPSTQSC